MAVQKKEEAEKQMKEWRVGSKIFSPTSIARYVEAKNLVESIPDSIEVLEGITVRCHELTRAVAPFLELTVTDGKFGAVEHSWIEWIDKDTNRIILDVYAVLSLPMVQLNSLVGLENKWWKKGEPRGDINWEVVDTLAAIMGEMSRKDKR